VASQRSLIVSGVGWDEGVRRTHRHVLPSTAMTNDDNVVVRRVLAMSHPATWHPPPRCVVLTSPALVRLVMWHCHVVRGVVVVGGGGARRREVLDVAVTWRWR
jgi:hypothetical protein